MRLSCFTAIAVMIALASLLAGCQSDPYCQQAIANLRAENIQLENQYYELKAMYESDMARLGQPAGATAPAYAPTMNNAQILYGFDQWVDNHYPAPTQRYVQPVLSPRMSGAAVNSPANVEMAGFIRAIEANQLPPQGSETVRILLRPLDEQGAILPLPGDIRIRMYDPTNGTTVFEDQFSKETVAGWINDQQGQQPGIHVALQQGRQITNGNRLICDVQYRTADNRILKQSVNLAFGKAFPPNPRNLNVNATIPFQPEPGLENDVQIEFGNELNFESLESDRSSSDWSPDR